MNKGLFFLVAILLVQSCRQPEPVHEDAERYRVIIMTDQTHDDGNSLIRYLYYSPWFDTEAIIVTNQLPDYDYDDEAPWEKAQSILSAYQKEYDQLVLHNPGFPTYEELLSVTKRGRGALPIIWLTEEGGFEGLIADRHVKSSWGEIRFSDWIGEGNNPNGEPKDSEGSEFLQEVFDKDDDRPIFVQMWGGPVTFVQALYRYRQRQGEEKFRDLMDKLHIYGIHLQDITFDFMIDLDRVRETGCLHMGETTSTRDGERHAPGWFLLDEGHFWKYIEAVDYRQVAGHGPLSDLYDHGGEGDTPAFLYLVSAALGLNDPLDPAQGSWGSMFAPMGEDFPDNYYHTCPVDQNELERWIEDATSSFMARLQWSVREPGEVNREPVAVINGYSGNSVIYKKAEPGSELQLDATGSYDPDGDIISFIWFHYNEASDYRGSINIRDNDTAIAKADIPVDIGDNELHIVLELRDDGKPSLVSYSRVIISAR